MLCGDPQASISPLLCLSQTPSTHFLQPIKVQVPLPPGVTGTTSLLLHRACLYYVWESVGTSDPESYGATLKRWMHQHIWFLHYLFFLAL